MTAIAQELDRRLQTLDPKRAAPYERLVRDVIALMDSETPKKDERRSYRIPTHDSALMPGIDPTKLGQMVDDL